LKTTKKTKLLTCCAFFDIKSAFDAAWHPAIRNSLIKKGCPRFLVKILGDFPSFRSSTLTNASSSFTANTELGCPQGSVLSPFLWNILIEELLSLSFPFSFFILAYGDDIVLCVMDTNFEIALANLQAMCDSAVAWGRSFKLTFNGLKSVFMVFSSKRILPSLPLKVDNVCVARSNSCLYFDLTIDDKLSWNTHIANKCAALKEFLFLILKCCRLSWGLSRNAISLLYKRTVIPNLLYNCSVWASAIRRKRVIAALKSA
jgi:hypothetical protein